MKSEISPVVDLLESATKERSSQAVEDGKMDSYLSQCFGNSSEKLTYHLIRQLMPLMPEIGEKKDVEAIGIAMELERAIRPQDALEAMLAAQMSGVHNLAMTFLARANIAGQNTQGINMNVDRATKLLRTFTAQIEALNRYRGKGQQKVTVEHVTVNHGGQAVIGSIERPRVGGGDSTSQAHRPHAKRGKASKRSR